MKEVQMTFRVESELRDNFNAAADKEHRPAAQVLREFMREYVAHVQQKQAWTGVSTVERNRRESAFHSACASVGLEGFKVPLEYEVQARRFINGEIDFSELTEAVHEQAARGK